MGVASKDIEGKTPALIREVSGVILAGGKSRRFGKNKAFVKIDGIPLIEKVTAVMRSVFQYTVLITNTPAEYAHLDLPMQEDLIKGLGPLGGLYSALMTIPAQFGFCVACDMPHLNEKLIRSIVELRDDFDAVVPRISGKMEALHAVYHKRCLGPIGKLINSGRYQVIQFFPQVSVRYVEEEEMRRIDPDLKSFYNVNMPQQLF